MMAEEHIGEINVRPNYDKELTIIADYMVTHEIKSDLAYETARYCLMDAIGCAFLALNYPDCVKKLGPIVPGTVVPNGSRVLGTAYVVDPVLAAFNIGTLIRWLDFNDTWLAAEWGHPSDNLGAILAVADFVSQREVGNNRSPLTMRDVLTAMIKAYEIQGMLALENSFNRMGLDHVVLVKVASAAVVMQMLGGGYDDIVNILSQAWIDGQSLRTYRHAPNTGSRKSWAAGDATSRAVRLAWLILQGEKGYPSALTAKTWGFYDVLFGKKHFQLSKPLNSYVMENILFKIAYPAEFHAQTAVECALILHPDIKNRLNDIEKIVIETQESAVRIISKTGPLHNPADRDHCIQYMVAAALLYGELKADHYEDKIADDERLDRLREKMQVQENAQYTLDYLDAQKRSIGNAIQVFFKDGSKTERVEVEYPLGHKRRRAEGIPLLVDKFTNNIQPFFSSEQTEQLTQLFLNKDKLESMAVNEFMEKFVL